MLTTTRTELHEFLRNGENSGVEFKRDTIDNRALAKELVAFANLGGGLVLLGVDDDGTVVGLTRASAPHAIPAPGRITRRWNGHSSAGR